MPANKPTLTLRRFGGLNNQDDAHEVGLDGFVAADNVDFTRSFKPRRRRGRTRVYSGAVRAAWGQGADFLFLEDDALKRLNADYTATTLRTGLTPSDELVACRVNDRLYWSNGFESGVLEDGRVRSWGLPIASSPALAPGPGQLPAGRYLAAATFVRSDGQEGPAARASVIETEHGIECSDIPTASDADVVGVNLYLSAPNGETLYRALSVVNGTTDASYGDDATRLVVPLETQFCAPPPAGHLITHFRGRLYIAHGAHLWFSDPYNHELVDARAGFHAFDDRVAVLGAVADGLYVATANATYFVAGAIPEEASAVQIADYGAIPGTLVTLEGGVIGEGAGGLACLWASARGLCVGFAGGNFRNVTERRVGFASATRGAGLFRHQDGQNHYLAVIQ